MDKSFKVMASVEGVKGQVGENIAGILEGQQKAEQLIAKTNEITEQSEIFVTRSGDLKNQMKWKNRKMTLILVALVVGITLAIVVPLIIKARNASSK